MPAENITPLQRHLRECYRVQHQARNLAADRLDHLLHAVTVAREDVDRQQIGLENIAVLLQESGYAKCDDYFDRVWPLKRPPEIPHPEPNAVSEEGRCR